MGVSAPSLHRESTDSLIVFIRWMFLHGNWVYTVMDFLLVEMDSPGVYSYDQLYFSLLYTVCTVL